MRIIEAAYDFGDLVYLKTDREQCLRMITRINVAPSGITYEATCGTQTSWHYEFELSTEKDILQTTTN